MNKPRPVFLNLTQIRLPLPGVASILHRISGIVIFLALPLLLWGLQSSLSGADGFRSLQQCLSHPSTKLIVWAILTAVGYHLLAGIRHIIMDFGLGESLSAARKSAAALIFAGVLVSVSIGVWLW